MNPEHAAGIANDEARNDRAGQAINDAAKARTSVLADAIERRMREAPGVEFDIHDVLDMVPGMSPTGARAALLWLTKSGRATEAHGYYSPVAP